MRNGFTLVELMITLALAAILLTLAVPSFYTTLLNNRLTTQINNLVTSLNLARSEAVKRGGQVQVCKTASGISCGGEWSQGWIVFADMDDSNTVTADDDIIQVHEAVPDGFRLISNFADRVSFRGTGTSASGTFILCDARNDDTLAKAVLISYTGRLRLTTASDSSLSCTD